MEPIDASVPRASSPRYQDSRSGLNIFLNVRREKVPFCPSSLSEKSGVLSGTNSRDKKGLNESRTVVRTTSDFLSSLYFLRVSFLCISMYVLSHVSRLDVTKMSLSSYD